MKNYPSFALLPSVKRSLSCSPTSAAPQYRIRAGYYRLLAAILEPDKPSPSFPSRPSVQSSKFKVQGSKFRLSDTPTRRHPVSPLHPVPVTPIRRLPVPLAPTLLTLATLLTLTTLLTGCTVLSYHAPTGEHFTRSSLGSKTSIAHLTFEAGTNGLRKLQLRGYENDSSQALGVVTDAAVKAAVSAVKP